MKLLHRAFTTGFDDQDPPMNSFGLADYFRRGATTDGSRGF